MKNAVLLLPPKYLVKFIETLPLFQLRNKRWIRYLCDESTSDNELHKALLHRQESLDHHMKQAFH